MRQILIGDFWGVTQKYELGLHKNMNCAFPLNIMKSIFNVCRKSARKTVKAKINEALLKIVLKK